MGQRTSETRDALAEMTERAQVISQEAGTKIAAAMKDVISAAAGIAGFAVESARDLVQYMVRRGQMTQDEADKLIKEAEGAHGRRAVERRSSTSKPAEKAPARPERSHEGPPKEEAKPTTNSAKRATAATAAAKAEKKPAKSAASPKKSAAKAPPKKKR